MLGIFFIYWVGKSFHTLAGEHNRNKWLWAILGLVTFYASQLIFGIIYFIVADIYEDPENETLLNLLGVVIGGLCTYGLYVFLKSRWSKVKLKSNPNVLDDDFLV